MKAIDQTQDYSANQDAAILIKKKALSLIQSNLNYTSSDQDTNTAIAPKYSFSKMSIYPQVIVQPKLTINQPNDIYEQEADAMADKIMRMPDKEISVSNSSNVQIQRKCKECEEEEKGLQRKESANAIPSVSATVSQTLQSPGQMINTATQSFMETQFGHDFSKVQIHNNILANQSAKDINALAYTYGNNIVFNSGQYNPGSYSGKSLLAHELTHVVQQGYAPKIHPHTSQAVAGLTEKAAEDITAERTVADQSIKFPYSSQPKNIQRKVLDNVITDFQPNPKIAKACIVHIHGEEQNALAVAKEMRKRRCINLVHLDTKERLITFEASVGKDTHVCKADPNRIFTDAGRDTEAIKTCKKDGKETSGKTPVKDAAKKELKDFAENDFGKQIGACRGGGAAPLDGTLPVVALHNNEGLSPSEKVAEKGANLPDDPANTSKKLPNPSLNDPRHPHDFFLVTQKEEFLKLRDKRNVIFQANPLPKGGDDGSLSVALKDTHYVNVEKEGRKFSLITRGGFKSNTITYVENFALAAEALDAIGAPDGLCSATDKVLSSDNPAAKALDDVTDTKGTTKETTDAEPLEREPVPEKPPKDCIVFKDQSALDTRKAEWANRLGKIPLREIINWILGGPNKPPSDAVKEVEAQKKCLIDAMSAGVTAKGLKIPGGKILKSELRTFKDQNSIWKRKFDFKGAKFDRISTFARAKCGALIQPTDVQWNPTKKEHRICWGVDKPSKTIPVTSLTTEEREKEILMASSAPGVSRHHLGTDFDFGRKDADLEPEAWTGKGDFADAFRWLARNASTWGFIQPFETKGGYGKGYMAERWHWSYYPIAQSLLEFAKAHESEIDAELHTHWEEKGIVKEEFKFITGHWQDYLFNVETKGRF